MHGGSLKLTQLYSQEMANEELRIQGERKETFTRDLNLEAQR